jgi:hypothetical protein
MPRLIYPFGPDGLFVPAVVALSAPALQTLLAQGGPLPVPLHARGVVDSGSTVTAVVPRLLAALNATPGPATKTTTAAGSVPVRFYRISFTIHNRPASTASFSQADWLVTDLAHDLPDVDILFGLDLLREVVLTVNGPGQTFSLDF